MAPQSFQLWALFLWSNGGGDGDVGDREQALPGEWRRDAAGRPRGARVGGRDARLDGRPEVLRPARHVAAHDAAAARTRRRRVRGRARLRRLLDPRLAGHLRVGHAADARPDLGDPRPGHRGADALDDLRDRRPDHAGGLLARPAPRRQARRGVPALHRDRGHVLRRPRVRVLRLRRGQLRPRPERRALLGRLARGLLELGQARPRLHVAAEGGVLPDGAARLAARPAHGDGADARAARDRVRVPPPRGRLRRPVRDRPPLRLADEDGRPGHDLQVRGQERRPRARQVGDVHAEADLRRQRLGDALPPVPLEGRDAADGRQVGLRGPVAARPRATSAACSSTRRRCSPSARRRRTRTGGSCPASRRR